MAHIQKKKYAMMRALNYGHPFDGYAGQDVMLFDEFRSSFPIADMLKYLEGYPLMLPCRYNDKVACFTKIFVVSNIKSIHYKEQGIPVIQSGFVTSGEFFADRYVYVNESKFREQYRCRANPLDIIVAKIGAHCGKCAVLPSDHPQSIIAGNCVKISVGKKNNPFLLQEILSACYDNGDIDLIKATTAQPAISLSKLKKMKIIYISPAEQQEIYIRANAVKTKIQSEQAYLTKLLNIKQGLMQDLLAHKVPVDALL